ncbi:AAA family ATPase [Pseudomonas aeruginosa]|nr:AAA family ATPase [Pseudomonas aeruginosa]
MKILAIRLKNLASLAGEQEIDFTREPLSSAGLFAITGPTGAGKSTVLDALCLALFGSTPRLESTSASSKVPDGRNELSSNDERNLLRRGCASGYAEVDFVGIDGHRYRARWETRRSRDKADGALQKSQQSLQDLETQQMLAANKKSEFREQLEQKLGLNFAQFTRAVLLAQSEFSAFLKASDNDRGALLEKLTDTGLYSQLSKAAYQRASQADEQRKQLEQRLEGSLPLAEQARAGLEAALESHAQARIRGATGTATSGRPATMVHRGAAAAAILRARTRPTGRGQAGLGRPGDGAGNPAMAGAPGSGSRTDRTPEATRAGTPALRAAAAAAHRAASRGRRALARIAGPLAGGARAPGPGRQPSASGPGAVARGFPAGERGQAPGANAGRATGTPSAIEPAPRPAKRRRSATGYGAAAPCRGTGATAGGIARQPGSRRARRRLGDPPGPARRLRATSPARARKPGAAPRAGKIPGPRR